MISEAAGKLGYEKVKEDQSYVLRKFVEGHNIFVSLPTGLGKSLCYQCLPALFDFMYCHDTPWSVIV